MAAAAKNDVDEHLAKIAQLNERVAQLDAAALAASAGTSTSAEATLSPVEEVVPAAKEEGALAPAPAAVPAAAPPAQAPAAPPVAVPVGVPVVGVPVDGPVEAV